MYIIIHTLFSELASQLDSRLKGLSQMESSITWFAVNKFYQIPLNILVTKI